MSINPSREQTRLNKTIQQIKDTEKEVASLTSKATNIREHFHAPTATLNTNLAKIDALVVARQDALLRLEANAYPDDDNRQMDAAQVKAAEESIKRLAEENSCIQGELNTLHATFDAQLAELMHASGIHDLAICALLVTKQQQEAALQRQEADYPVKLKRHLNRCRRQGIADARLSAPKKRVA
jgi:chromosome segregation ATPase